MTTNPDEQRVDLLEALARGLGLSKGNEQGARTERASHGTPLRDGAVDPRADDYLGPSNAGEPGELGNPHGPNVVNPGLPDEWPTYAAWRAHVVNLGLPDPGPHRFGNHIH